MKPNNNIGEAQITPELAQKVAPDVMSPQGQQQLQAKSIAANRFKGVIDKALGMAAQKLGGTHSTRVKQLDTATQKIVQKRLQGRSYDIDNLNDMFGGRIVLSDKDDFGKAKDEIIKMSKAGLFKIKHMETVKTGNYDAYHVDIVAPDGLKGEIQLHTPRSEAESIANHDMRALHGEKPPTPVKKLVDDNKPIHPLVTAHVLTHV